MQPPLEAAASPTPEPHAADRLETLGRLAAGITHDFANLMTVISGYAEILVKRTHPTDGLRVELDEIRRAAQIGSRLTAQLLDYLHRRPGEARSLDLNTVVGGVVDMLRPILKDEIQIDTRWEAGLPAVVADRSQIEQVVLNLVLNAADAMPAGGQILVEAATLSLEGAEAQALGVAHGMYVALRVADNGPGMDESTLRQAFEPGFSGLPSNGHSGLGLATVRRIAGNHGGAASARTAPGAGSVFTVLLPC